MACMPRQTDRQSRPVARCRHCRADPAQPTSQVHAWCAGCVSPIVASGVLLPCSPGHAGHVIPWLSAACLLAWHRLTPGPERVCPLVAAVGCHSARPGDVAVPGPSLHALVAHLVPARVLHHAAGEMRRARHGSDLTRGCGHQQLTNAEGACGEAPAGRGSPFDGPRARTRLSAAWGWPRWAVLRGTSCGCLCICGTARWLLGQLAARCSRLLAVPTPPDGLPVPLPAARRSRASAT